MILLLTASSLRFTITVSIAESTAQPSLGWESFPWPLRLLFAAPPELLTRYRASTAVINSTGLTRTDGSHTGVVTFI